MFGNRARFCSRWLRHLSKAIFTTFEVAFRKAFEQALVLSLAACRRRQVSPADGTRAEQGVGQFTRGSSTIDDKREFQGRKELI